MVGMTIQQERSSNSGSGEDSSLHSDWEQDGTPDSLPVQDSSFYSDWEQKSTAGPPPVEDLPHDSDWETWIKDAVCFSLVQANDLKIYGVNPNDCSCYHLASFTFNPISFPNGWNCILASCTIIGSNLYVIGRNDADNHNLTKLWIWDIAEAQKEKLTGKPYEWKLGPCLNSGKSKVLAFSIGGDLYALDILRLFFPPTEYHKPIRLALKEIDENPIDFERLQIKSSSRDPPLSWVPLPALQLEKYCCRDINGHYCLHDRLLLHMVHANPLETYLFCFNVTTNKWTHQHFYSLPLTSYIPLEELEEPQLRCNQYSAQVENHGLFLNTRTGVLSVCDFNHVCDSLENGSGSDLKDPFFPLDIDQAPVVKDVIHGTPYDHFFMFQTFCLGDKRNCWLAFYHGCYGLCLKICTFDLEKKTLVETSAKKPEEESSRGKEMVENTAFYAVKDFCRGWSFDSNVYVLPKML